MCTPDLMCLASRVSKILKGYENFNVSRVTQATLLSGINVTFLASTDLINNCAKFEACSFSRSEDTICRKREAPRLINLFSAN